MIKIWIAAARPKTLIASLSPIFIGSVLAFAHHSAPFGWFACILLTGLGIQIGTNLSNDYYDCLKGADSAQRKGPLRVTAAGLVSMPTMRKAIVLTWICTLILGLPLIVRGGIIIALLLATAIFLGWMYTGGPYPLGYLGLGECFVFPFFGPVATACTYTLLTHTFSWEAVYAGISPGLFAMAILIVNNIRDIQEDRCANKRTLVVRWGTRFGLWEYGITSILAVVLPLFLYASYPWILITLFVLPFVILLIYRLATTRTAHNQILAQTGALLWAYTALFMLGVLYQT